MESYEITKLTHQINNQLIKINDKLKWIISIDYDSDVSRLEAKFIQHHSKKMYRLSKKLYRTLYKKGE